jgi:hypothetical protein
MGLSKGHLPHCIRCGNVTALYLGREAVRAISIDASDHTVASFE